MLLMKLCICGKAISKADAACPSCMEIKAQSKAANAAAYDKNMRKNAECYKDKRWLKTRSFVLNRDKRKCLMCKSSKSMKAADMVHHIVPIEDDESLKYSTGNCISLCNKHHGEVHIAYKIPRAKVMMQDKLRALIILYSKV